MRFNSLTGKTGRAKRLALEKLEHRTLLSADSLTLGLQQNVEQDQGFVSDTSEAAGHSIIDNNLVVLAGDANRDGLFDQRDLLQLFLAGKYQSGVPADWSEGDWNGDNVFDQRDVIAALQIGKYTPQAGYGAGGPPDEAGKGVLTKLAEEAAARIAADALLNQRIDDIQLIPGPQGVPGPVGPAGPPGPAAPPPTLVSYLVSGPPVTLPPGFIENALVECPPGTTLTGGAGTRTVGRIGASHPNFDTGNGWVFRVWNDSSIVGSATAHALCITTL